jgi:NitT/TauT family transport system substrate-binding protein
MRRFLGMAGLAAALLVASPVSAEVTSVTIGIQNGVAYLPLQVMAAKKLVEKRAQAAKLPLTASIRNLGSAGMVRDALLAGEIQFGVAGPPTLIIMHDKTGGDIKAIGASVSVPMWLNSTNPNIKGICDFKATDKIALPTVKSSVQAVALQMASLKECGRFDFNDRFTVSMTHPDGYNALMSGMITSHLTTAPFQYDEVEKGKGKVRTIFDSNKFFGHKATLVYLIASDKFRIANPKAYKVVREALDEAMVFIKAHPREAVDIYMAAEKSKDSAADVLKQITSPDIIYTTTPIDLGRYASFMYQIRTVKKNYTWQDLSMPELRSKKGS